MSSTPICDLRAIAITVVLFWAALVATASGQCTATWTALSTENPFIDGEVLAMESSGSGCGALLFAGGGSRIKVWDGVTWDDLAGGVGLGVVTSLYYGDIGEGASLYMGGNFFSIGDEPVVSARNIARWDAATDSWHALGDGLDQSALDPFGVQAIIAFDEGVSGTKIYAGGKFSDLPGQSIGETSPVAAWDGTSWVAVSAGLQEDSSFDVTWDLAVFDGDLYAGGWFFEFVDGPQNNVVYGVSRWNGSSWASIGDFEFGSGEVYALEVWDDGNGPALYVGGSFEKIGGVTAHGIAKWDGSAWSALGSGLDDEAAILELQAYSDRSGSYLFAAGFSTDIGGISANGLAKWDGSSWSVVGEGGPVIPETLHVFDTGGATVKRLIAAGGFTTPFPHFAQWDGCHCFADTDDDGDLDVFDMTTFSGWLSGSDPRADLNCDGVFDFFDMQTYLGLYSAGCS